jgi:hypothetical protein
VASSPQQSVNVAGHSWSTGMARTRLPTLEELSRLDLEALKHAWTSVFSGAPPQRMPRDFLIKLLAQGLQERGAGGFPKALERALAKAPAAAMSGSRATSHRAVSPWAPAWSDHGVERTTKSP